VRQAVNRLEDAGYVHYDDGLSVSDERVGRRRTRTRRRCQRRRQPPRSRRRTSSRSSVTGRSRSRGSTPSTYGHRAATKSVATPRTIRCSWPSASKMSTTGKRFSTRSTFPPHSSDNSERSWTDRCRSSLSHAHHSTSSTSRGIRSSRELRPSSTCMRTTPNSSRRWRCLTGCTRISSYSEERLEV